MMISMSWRNVWRNRSRSLVLMMAVALGIWAGIVAVAFFYGMNEQRIEDATRLNLSHIQIHRPEYVKDPLSEYTIPSAGSVNEILKKHPQVKVASLRNLTETMVNAPHGSRGANVMAVNPEDESSVTGIDQSLLEGDFLKSGKHPVVLGKKLADALGLKLKSKVVIHFTSPDGEFVKIEFRVGGIFKTKLGFYDLTTVFVRLSDLQQEPALSNAGIHEIAILTDDYKTAGTLADQLQAELPSLKVQTWKQIAPEMGYAHDFIDLFLLIFMGIIMVALAFGILNTMLMAVMERTREIGMVMSLGMNKLRVFSMIVLETVFLTTTATPIGLGLGFLTVTILQSTGVDLSVVGEGMAEFGIDTLIIPWMPGIYYLYITGMVFCTALIISIFPALRAMRLSPAEATRKL